MKIKTGTTAYRMKRPLGAAWTTRAAAVIVVATVAPGSPRQDLRETRAVIEEYVETRRIMSAEQAEWMLGRELLSERIDVVRREIENVRSTLDKTRGEIRDMDEKRTALLEENDLLKTASGTYRETLQLLEARTRELLPRLPDPIRERVKPLAQRIPDDPNAEHPSLSERYGNVVGLLNEINRFQREVSVASSVRELSNGTTAEVTVLYIGISQGYYVDAAGRAAGIGSSSADGWSWRAADEWAPAVARAIAILRNEEAAEFVQLPIQIE